MSQLEQSIAEIQKNPQQWQAFNTFSDCVVLAPPGSGKTKLLTTRLAFDLQNSIPRPQGAVCITLTNAAANELRRRLDVLGAEKRNSLFVGTVHAFARGRIVEPYAKAVGRPWLTSLRVATSIQCNRLLAEATTYVYGSSGDRRYVDSTVSVARQRLTKGSDWARYGDQIRAVSEEYERALLELGLCDFTGLVAHAVEMVESSGPLRKVLNMTYPFLYVDEYQDLAPGLDRIVRALCLCEDSGTVLFAVGDPDQAVYAFTGTRPELLQELAASSGVEVVELDRNYRSGQSLIDIAGRMRPGKVPVVGVRGGGEAWTVCCPHGFNQQITHAVELVQDALGDGVAPDHIAVICPWNQHCEEVAQALRDNGIRASVRESEYRITIATQLIEACAIWATAGRETSGCRLSEILSAWRQLLGSDWAYEHDVQLTSLLLDSRTAGDTPMRVLLERVLLLGLDRMSSDGRTSEESIALARMADALRTGRLKDLSVAQFVARVRRKGCVEVLNMTVSKGLEFDRVIIIGLDDEMVPHYKSLRAENAAQLAEDRRKFYVALTRARDEVFMLYSGFVDAPWGRKTTAPSLFMREIGLIR